MSINQFHRQIIVYLIIVTTVKCMKDRLNEAMPCKSMSHMLPPISFESYKNLGGFYCE